MSFFMKAVTGLMKDGSISTNILKEGLKMVVGCGDKVAFWEDGWRDGIPLNIRFPRIFALSMVKDGTVEQFGQWCGEEWRWKVCLRRGDWEKDIWEDFCYLLESVSLKRCISDSVAWNFCPNGLFSVSSFKRCIEEYRDGEDVESVSVWKGFSPPKVELFLWQLLRGRVMVREVLGSFGVAVLGNSCCPLCGGMEESVDHLFLLCAWSWGLWKACMRWWNVQSCVSKNIKEWFGGWNGLCPKSSLKRVWETLLNAVVWTTWEARNQVVFQGKSADFIAFLDLVRFRVAWWFKFHGKGSVDPITVMVENLEFNCVEQNKKKKRKRSHDSWIPPYNDSLKFNVDGSFIRRNERAGIGGVLRDAKGVVLCSFSAGVEAADATAVELLAI
ncbi:hypothetical protein LWI29_006099 [Acer saccharum]|uniref:Reverse transcriptase zinc-binding domain-containing protein n=1 Tax=Acer saccharum TaxID=4024 RepID=A0AA39RKH8_ACESA|nr:hypothetical protein LWI29_006099 [Acer saccharum]